MNDIMWRIQFTSNDVLNAVFRQCHSYHKKVCLVAQTCNKSFNITIFWMALINLNILVLILHFIKKIFKPRKQFFVKTNSDFHYFFSDFGIKIYLKKNYSALYFFYFLYLTIHYVYSKNLDWTIFSKELFSVKNHERYPVEKQIHM